MYHNYYQHKIREFKGGDKLPEPTPEQIHTRQPELQASESSKNQSRLIGRVLPMVESRELQRRRKINVPAVSPGLELYAIVVPPDLPELDLNAMKLAAQFTAKNGPSFEHGLLLREARNPMFAFLEPRHSLHSTFRRLVQSYERAILVAHDLSDQLAALEDQNKQLSLALDRWVFQAEQQQQRQLENANDDELRQINAAVDWHDFALVGELTFDGDDVAELPPIVTVQLLRQLARLEAAAGTTAEPQAEAGDGADMDMDEDVSADMEMSGDGAANADIDPNKIRDSFVRTSAAASARAAATQMQVCPRCGVEIPVDEMAEHMRIELLDPKYIEERKRNEEKTRERSYADPSSVAANLKRLAQKRNEMAGGGAVEDAPRLAALQKPVLASAAATSAAAAAAAAAVEQFDSVADDGDVQHETQSTATAATTARLPPVPVQLPPVPMPGGWVPGMPLPTDFTMPPMPPGWRPGMPLPPIPGFMAPPQGMPIGMPPPGSLPLPVPLPVPIADAAGDAKRVRLEDGSGVAVPSAGGAPTDANDDDEGDEGGASVGQVAAVTWAKQVPRCTLRVEATADTSKAAAGWGLAGQTIELGELDSLTTTVERVKALLSAQLGGMPVKKQKLMLTRTSQVLKDSVSLAALNFGESEALAVSVKTRGGRKK